MLKIRPRHIYWHNQETIIIKSNEGRNHAPCLNEVERVSATLKTNSSYYRLRYTLHKCTPFYKSSILKIATTSMVSPFLCSHLFIIKSNQLLVFVELYSCCHLQQGQFFAHLSIHTWKNGRFIEIYGAIFDIFKKKTDLNVERCARNLP